MKKLELNTLEVKEMNENSLNEVNGGCFGAGVIDCRIYGEGCCPPPWKPGDGMPPIIVIIH